MIRLLGLFALLTPLTLQAQFTYLPDQSIPVRDLQGGEVSLPWAGGLNASQFNTMDLDGDGIQDLVLFDRMANKVITLVARNDAYLSAPEYENLFPADLSNWLLLRDYNCDGRKDIFTGDVLGIKVYRNIGLTGSPEWERHLFSTGFPGPKSTVLLTEGTETKVNLQLQFDDLPSIGDVDGDGDIDILNIQYAGHTVEFHQNLAIEKNLPCDSLEFKRVTRSWGNFRECACGQFAFDGQDCPPNTGGRTKHAGGKSLLALDLNGDQQQDLLISEADCTSLYALTNSGTSLDPVINSAARFPENTPVNFVVFPAAFHEDVDFDGLKDLIATPNIFTHEYLNTDLQHSTWFYKNTGSVSNPVFTFVEKNFLQNRMIDVGDNAVPAFADFDGDGDLDMFISSYSSASYSSRVYLYENTGSASSPAFKLRTDDYFGFSGSKYYNLKIQFVDIDSDQTTDLVFTATSFDNSLTNLYYINNKSSTHLDFSASTLKAIGFPMTSTENVCVTDVSGDGLPDILAGRSEGNLEYWKNTGIGGVAQFVMEEENFLGYDNSTLRQNLACAAADLDVDGKMDLLVGDQLGRLEIISDYQNPASHQSLAERDIIFNPLLERYTDRNLGGRIWPAVANLFNASKPGIAVGNVLGGIHLLRHDEGQALHEEPEVHIYPNPVAKDEVLNVQVDREATVQVVSMLGQQVSPAVVLKAHQIHRYTVTALASGLYLLRVTANKKSHAQRFIVK